MKWDSGCQKYLSAGISRNPKKVIDKKLKVLYSNKGYEDN